MNVFEELYRGVPSLGTDLYELTMACGYWKLGIDQRRAVFQMTFRRNPFGGAFTVSCGQHVLADFLAGFRFSDNDIEYLRRCHTATGERLFPDEFLDYLARLQFTCDVEALPEGCLAFPGEPLVRVTGPLLQAQLIETPLLCLMNFSSLVASKAARVCLAAQGDTVLDFGLRRAQGLDGGLSASRAAFVGGCAGTSNVLAGKLFDDIPVRGTHAHSWVMVFDSEREAFQRYAEVMPQNGILLVDTYDTAEGIQNAIRTAETFRRQGGRLVAIRLDSGDLAALSRFARSRLDEAGLNEVKIVASGDLDEYRIADLKQKQAPIDLWGVGTRLVTGYDDPALTGVYKLVAVENEAGEMRPRFKFSEEPGKQSPPGPVQVERHICNGQMVADMLFADDQPPAADEKAWHLPEFDAAYQASGGTARRRLLEPLLSGGKPVDERSETLSDMRRRVQKQLQTLPEACRRLRDPATYPVTVAETTYRHWQQIWGERDRSDRR